MFEDEKFEFNINQIKNDLQIEGMKITDSDIDIFRKYSNKEIDANQMISLLKEKPMGE